MSGRHRPAFVTLPDILFIVLLALIGLGLAAGIYLPSHDDAGQLEVVQNGTVIMTFPLDREMEKTITDKTGGSNTFRIENGRVTMIAASCGDKTCINTGAISHTGESIVCLPHRLVLRAAGGRDDGPSNAPDAVVR